MLKNKNFNFEESNDPELRVYSVKKKNWQNLIQEVFYNENKIENNNQSN